MGAAGREICTRGPQTEVVLGHVMHGARERCRAHRTLACEGMPRLSELCCAHAVLHATTSTHTPCPLCASRMRSADQPSTSTTAGFVEPILQENPDRFTMFPIQ